MPEHCAEAHDHHYDAGDKGKALGRFGARENAAPNHIDGEARDASHAGSIADPISWPGSAEGIYSDDDAREAGNDRECLLHFELLVEEERCEKSDQDWRGEDEDIEEREGHVAQGHYDTDIVGNIQARAKSLSLVVRGQEHPDLAAHHGIRSEERGDKEADESYDLVGGQSGSADHLDGTVGKDPKGEAG